MSWRVALGAFVAFLLPVPLVLLMSARMNPERQGSPPDAARISPVLDIEERTRRVTYKRHCQESSDCEAPLGCLADLRVMTRYCIDSQCMTDMQCPDGLVCQSLPTLGGGPLVRFCIPPGVRQEGEKCFRPPGDKEEACGPGLLCGGRLGRCGRPCHPDEAMSCPEGFFCADVAPQPICLPTCEARGCPEGQQCVRFEEGVSVCAVVHGPNCQQSPCPEGRECQVDHTAKRPGQVWMECVHECSEEHPVCPEGLVCNRWRCQTPCDPLLPGACGENHLCARRRPGSPWVCELDG